MIFKKLCMIHTHLQANVWIKTTGVEGIDELLVLKTWIKVQKIYRIKNTQLYGFFFRIFSFRYRINYNNVYISKAF